jgi:prepilin-type N-terminal cleavage/methylation domain-containing protein
MLNLFKVNKKGMSLIEMIVAISIFTIGIIGFTLLFSSSWKSNSFIMEEGMASMQATQSVRAISAQLRDIRQSDTGEYLLKTATENELVVYREEDGDGKIERVRYFLDDSNKTFKKGVAEASGTPLTYPSNYSADTITTIAMYVVNTDNSEPLFKYYNNANNQLSSPATPTSVRIIELNLWINIKPLTAPDNVRIGTSVEIRNLDESI